MAHSVSAADRAFVQRLERGDLTPPEFDHGAHVRIAYTYLVDSDVESAVARMRAALGAFLQRNGIPATKYHETLTRAWVMAVRHFMARSQPAESAGAFIAGNPALLDSGIMLTHYSADLLFSDAARAAFVEPDVQAIPKHDA